MRKISRRIFSLVALFIVALFMFSLGTIEAAECDHVVGNLQGGKGNSQHCEYNICSKCSNAYYYKDSWHDEKPGHTWIGPTCTIPKTCSVCFREEGEPAGHQFGEYTYRSMQIDGNHEATCTSCGKILTEQHTAVPVPKGDNNYHDFKCSVCGQDRLGIGDPRRNHVYDGSRDLHICTICNEANTLSKHHGFGGATKCVNGDCTAVLSVSVKTDPGIKDLGTLPQYFPRCQPYKWTKPTPNGKLVVQTNLKPYVKDQSD